MLFPACTCVLLSLLSLLAVPSVHLHKCQNTLRGVDLNKSCLEYALRLLSYLSVLGRISFPFFHRLIAGGQASGLHSRVTSLPERAFSSAFMGLFEKLGGEAVNCGARE